MLAASFHEIASPPILLKTEDEAGDAAAAAPAAASVVEEEEEEAAAAAAAAEEEEQETEGDKEPEKEREQGDEEEEEEEEEDEEEEEAEAPLQNPSKPAMQADEPPVKRKRGRPRKYPASSPLSSPSPQPPSSAKRKRGRPPKTPLRPAISPSPSGGASISFLSSPADPPTTKRKRGRPRKDPHPARLPPPSLSPLPLHLLVEAKTSGAAPATITTADASPLDDVEILDTEVSVERVKKRGRGRPPKTPGRRGRPPKRMGEESPKQLKQMKAQMDHSAERTFPRRERRYLKDPSSPTIVSPALPTTVMPAHADVMGEVVKHSPFMDAVVKVFCVHTEPNFSLPWQMKRQISSNSSGFIISGRRVLTNAHSVEHHTQVKVKRRGSDTKFVATVLAIGTECDIALLTVANDEFWEGVSPVEFGSLPSLQDAVTVVGYPIGGDTISVTSGVVSRIEVTSYVHGATELLGVQIDAAINAGNSGGPAFNDKGRCVGIAFQSLKNEDAENIGYVIPTPVINHFINDYGRNGEYTGFPILGIDWQKIENPDLRKSLGMGPHQKGVRVRRVEPTAPAARYIQSSDILLSFDGIDVANDGTVPFRRGERIGFSYLVSQKYTGEQARIKILRDAKFMEFDVKLETHKRLVPAHIKGKPPSYFIVAGIVFAAVSVPYLRSEYGKDYDYDAPVKLLDKLLHSMAQTEDEQLVVISQVLVADVNIGYEDIVNTQIIAFNGVPVRNLKHLAYMVENCKEEFMKFDLEYQQMVVLDTKKAKKATPEILATHCIPSAASDDLKA